MAIGKASSRGNPAFGFVGFMDPEYAGRCLAMADHLCSV